MWNPPGYQPGYHVPGTTVPIAYALEVSQRRAPPPPPLSPDAAATRHEEMAKLREAYAEARTRRIVDLEHMSDPIGRLLGALWSFSQYLPPSPGSSDAAIYADADVLRHLLPGLWPPPARFSLGKDPSWNSEEICDWFLKHAQQNPPSTLRFERKRIVGYKEVRVPGWGFPQGSTFWVDHAGGGNFLSAGLTVRGDIIVGSTAEDRPGSGLNALALQAMAKAAGLTIAPQTRRQVPRSTGRPYDANQLLREIAKLEATTGLAVGQFVITSDWVDAT